MAILTLLKQTVLHVTNDLTRSQLFKVLTGLLTTNTTTNSFTNTSITNVTRFITVYYKFTLRAGLLQFTLRAGLHILVLTGVLVELT